MLDRNYSQTNFPTKHLMKDTKLFITEAESAGLNVSSLEGVRKILELALERAFSEQDYSSLFSVINPEEPLDENEVGLR